MKEKIPQTSLYLKSVTAIGLMVLLISLFFIEPIDHWLIYLTLIGIMWVCEQFPIPTGRGSSSLAFPIVYTLFLVHGLSVTMLSVAVVVILVNVIHRRPLLITVFNASQLTLSLAISVWLLEWTIAAFDLSSLSLFYFYTWQLGLLTFYCFIFNNLFYDLAIIMRGIPYKLETWLYKTGAELVVAVFSFLYSWFMIILGQQDRGIVDVISYFFFFSPLIGLSLVISIIIRLQQERRRLQILFSITNELNRNLTSPNWMEQIIKQLKSFLFVDASLLWLKEEGRWYCVNAYGKVTTEIMDQVDISPVFNKISYTKLFQNRKNCDDRLKPLLNPSIQTVALAPLQLEGETVGMWVVGRMRAYSFRKEDVQSIATLANQMAIFIKSRRLVKDHERHQIYEERNRIAREIHDGIAQSLAGAVMNLETAQKKFKKKPLSAIDLVADSLQKLRGSLKELRQSIYELRPDHTKHIGLVQALEQHVHHFKGENNGVEVDFNVSGEITSLSYMVENVIFNICKEALRNIEKHSRAGVVDIGLKYKARRIMLTVRDDGVGFSLMNALVKAKQDPHFGIVNMHELADQLGATLQIDSKEGQGTSILLTIPRLEDRSGDKDDSFDAR